jgi:hypothetical protein
MSEMITNNYIPKLLFIATTAVILGLMNLITTSAATPTGSEDSLGVSPVKKKYAFDAGKSSKDSITVINAGDTTLTLKMSVEPYSVKGETYESDFLTVRKNTDLKSWVSFEKSKFILKGGESMTVPYSITVPANAIPGGHYGAIFAETVLDKSSPENAALGRNKRVGTLIYATVNGEYEMGGKSLGIRTPGLQFKAPLKSELTVENTGNSDFTAETVFAVSDILGNRKHTAINEFELLPQTIRKIPLQWDKSPGFGFYKVTVSAKFLDQKTSKTSYVLLAPLAYYMIFVVALLIAVIVFVAKRR